MPMVSVSIPGRKHLRVSLVLVVWIHVDVAGYHYRLCPGTEHRQHLTANFHLEHA